MRKAAALCRRIYPGAVGELIERELRAAEEFHYVLSETGLAARLTDEVLAAAQPPG